LPVRRGVSFWACQGTMGGSSGGFLTPKAIAKRIKSKGLQKLRWYCQMCEKQCRDENGFKCHLKSETHLRQMAIFGQNAEKFVEGYSKEFEKTFLQHFRTAHRTTRIAANVIYNEFIADRNHVHMNSTKWTTLTEFVVHLGRTGKCKVEETPKGWFLRLVAKDEDEQLRDKLKGKRKRAEEAEEVRHARFLRQQVERARAAATTGDGNTGVNGFSVVEEASELKRDGTEAPLGFELSKKKPPATLSGSAGRGDLGRDRAGSAANAFGVEAFSVAAEGSAKGGEGRGAARKKKSALEEIMQEQEALKKRKEKVQQEEQQQLPPGGGGKGCWLFEGIVVKVVSKELKGAGFYKEKAAVRRVIDQGGRFLGELEHLKSGAILRVDQAQLETVIPKPGGKVLVLLGEHAGAQATLVGVDTKKFKAQVELAGNNGDEARLWMEYDDISKCAV